jgi:hypothetical protein
MHFGNGPSWRMSVEPCSEAYDDPLWFRAAEHLDVPAGGIVPGPLDIEPVPAPTTGPDAGLAAEWQGWWRALAGLPRWPSREATETAWSRETDLLEVVGEPPTARFGPPDFPGLAEWPALARVVRQRWPEANRWHNDRVKVLMDAPRGQPPLGRGGESRLVAEVERERGRKAPPFDIEFIVVPVRDTEIRPLADDRYLVPLPVYGSPQWSDWLRVLVRSLF